MLNVRKNDRFESLIDGKERLVDLIDKSTGDVVFDDGLKVSDLTAFNYLGNDTPIVIKNEDIVINDGKLTVEDNEIEVGTLKIKKAISTIRENKILLLVDSLKENYFDVFEYDVKEDSFFKVLREITSIEKLYDCEQGEIYLVDKVEKREIEVINEETGEYEKTNIEEFSNNVFVYDKVNRLYDNIIGLENPLGSLSTKKETENKLVLVYRSKKGFEDVIDASDYRYPVLCDLEDKNEIVTELIFNKELDEYTESEEDEEYVFVGVDVETFDVKDEIVEIQCTYRNNESLLIITEGGIIFTNNGYYPRVARGKDVFEAAIQHPYFVRLKPGTRYNEFVLANKQGEVVTISVTKTDDRGFVTSIK